jgi:thioester reductase-like protein
MPNTILLTGATGLIGSCVLRHLGRDHPNTRFLVLVRSTGRWHAIAPALGLTAERTQPVGGDLSAGGLGLRGHDRARIIDDVDSIIHCAADVSFSRPLAQARAVNTEGTRRLLELAAVMPRLQRFVQVSTAFVVGRQTGRIESSQTASSSGWVNGYEQSKAEAELLVRNAGVPWTILRPSTVVCDDIHGRISQYNAIHRALYLSYSGLTSMLPGTMDTPIDVVTAEYVSSAIATLAVRPDTIGQAFHLCAGSGAITLGDLLDRSFAVWQQDAQWLRRSVPRPALTDLATYRLFEQSIEDTADARLRTISRALSHFAPQLAYAKHFDNSRTDAVLGYSAPPARAFWDAMVRQLLITHWGGELQRVA